MSYDLYLKPKNGAFSADDLVRYFSGRKHYTVEDGQAWYSNEDTGVYFVFEMNEPDEDDQGGGHYPVLFNMNFFRPSYFVNEAEPELSSFVAQFEMEADDPQNEGMGCGDYDREKFVSGWLHGNDFGYRALLGENPEVETLPADTLRRMWAWNFNRAALQDSITDDVFVPRIVLASHKGATVTACVWPDAIPTLVPEVDILLIGRQSLAPRRLFRRKEDLAIAPWPQFLPLFEKYKTRMLDGAWYLHYGAPPAEVRAAVKQLEPSPQDELTLLAYDQVLDREAAQQYTA